MVQPETETLQSACEEESCFVDYLNKLESDMTHQFEDVVEKHQKLRAKKLRMTNVFVPFCSRQSIHLLTAETC